MQLSNDGGFANAVWQTYQPASAWTLRDVGARIATLLVYVRFRAANGTLLCNGAPVNDDIIFDAQAPVIAQITRLGNQLQVVAEDQPGGSGVADQQVSAHADFADAAWLPWQEPITLDAFPEQLLYVRVRDSAGNESDPFSILIEPTNQVYLPVTMR